MPSLEELSGRLIRVETAPAGSGVAVLDEGASLGSFVSLNFAGAGVIATNAGSGVALVTIPGGGGVVVVNDLTTGGTTSALSAQQGVVLKGITDGLTAHIGSGGAAHANVVAAGAAGFMTGADKTKLDGVATGATANSADAFLLDRANHTGTQLASTVSDFTEAAQDATAAFLVAGSNITLTHNDAANTLTIASTGGGGGSATVTATTVTVPYGSRDYLATITDAAVTGTSKPILVPGLCAQTDVNISYDASFSVESVAAGSFTMRLASTGRETIGGPFKFFYMLG